MKILIDEATVRQVLETLGIGLDYVRGEQFENAQRFKGYMHLAPDDESCAKEIEQSITSLRKALAEQPAQQEPVAWESLLGAIARGWCHEKNANKEMDADLVYAIATEIKALYTTPPQRKPLTDEELDYWIGSNSTKKALCRAVEAAHGIRE